MANKRMMLVVNPNAGKGGYKNSLADILEEFCRNDWEPTVFFTRGVGHAPALVAREASAYDMVTCLGGDGTLSEVAAGLMSLPERPPIGYIPLGTANDVARTLGLSHKPIQAARDIIKGERLPFDMGQLGGEYFTYIAAFGAFTEVSYGTPQESKHTLGHMAYLLEGLKSLSKISSVRAIVEYDDGVEEGDYLFGGVTNSTSIAGLLRLDREAVKLSDGMFEVLLIQRPKDLADLNEIVTALMTGNFNVNKVRFLKSREVRIMFAEPVAWTRDGEDGGKHRDVMIVNRHPGVEIIV